jgi:two-component system, sensor histidine kinase and response regulator
MYSEKLLTVFRRRRMLQKSKSSILIVDDTEENLKILSTILEHAGYDISIQNDGLKALSILKDFKPDLILLDVMMPQMDGFEVCEKIKGDPETKNIPVIFLTARSSLEDLLKGFQVGGVDYIKKPFRKDELLARVSSHIELVRTKKLLEDSNHTKDLLFSVIAHDLKNNIGGTVSWLRILDDPDSNIPREQEKDIVRTVLENSESTMLLMENLLDWARDQRNTISIHPESLHISEVIDEASLSCFGLMKKKKIIIDKQFKSEDVCFCDRNTLKTILRNLISNAIKYSKENGKITITGESSNSEFLISVIDEGIGMNEETLNLLFHDEEIISKSGTSGEKGTGFGLKLCKQFVEMNKGIIGVKSEPGKGSNFFFTLPIFPYS